ncbi:MAG: nucleotidyltransferase domain-containing protein [Candidatus Falkowbacteria bacterium]
MLNLLKNNQGKILNLFFKDPEKDYYLREIAKNLGKEPGVFQKAIEKLIKEGILKDERRGNLRFFKLNKNYPIYEEIKKIVSKTLGIEAQMKELVDGLEGVEYVFIFGSIAKGNEYSESDIDLMLVGTNVDQDDLIEKVSKLEIELGREINYHVYDKKEIIKKIKDKNDFILNVFNDNKIVLKGNLNELTRLS